MSFIIHHTPSIHPKKKNTYHCNHSSCHVSLKMSKSVSTIHHEKQYASFANPKIKIILTASLRNFTTANRKWKSKDLRHKANQTKPLFKEDGIQQQQKYKHRNSQNHSLIYEYNLKILRNSNKNSNSFQVVSLLNFCANPHKKSPKKIMCNFLFKESAKHITESLMAVANVANGTWKDFCETIFKIKCMSWHAIKFSWISKFVLIIFILFFHI